MSSSRKYPCPPEEGLLEIPRGTVSDGEGKVSKQQNYKGELYEPKLEFSSVIILANNGLIFGLIFVKPL